LPFQNNSSVEGKGVALITQGSRQVGREIQQRGRDYYHQGAVQILRGDPWSVLARVQGGQDYQVSLERDGDTVRVSCSCPYFEQNLDSCKHIWATLLAAEARNYLGGDGSTRSLRLVPDEEAVDQGEEEFGSPDYRDEWDDGEEDWDGPDEEPARFTGYIPPPPRRPRKPRKKRTRKPKPSWKQQLQRLRQGMQVGSPHGNAWPTGREILYVIDVAQSLAGRGLTLEVSYRERKQNGEWSKPRNQRIGIEQIANLPDPADRQILSLLVGAREQNNYYNGYTYGGYYGSYYDSAPRVFRLSEPLHEALVPRLCQTGRCFLRLKKDDADLVPLHWDEGPPWEFWLEVRPEPSGKSYTITADLRRGEARMALSTPVMLVSDLVFWQDQVARLRDFGAFNWIDLLRKQGTLSVPAKQVDKLVPELLQLPHLPRLDLPEELRFTEVSLAPRPRLKVKAPVQHAWGPDRLRGELSFDYGDQILFAHQADRGVYQADQRRFLLRDPAAEVAAAEELRQLGFRPARTYGSQDLELAPRNLPHVVRTLLERGWHVEAEGKLYRNPGAIRIEVNSGIDWFELHGTVDFGEATAQLPALLAALRRGENTVRLDDGTFGMLPEEWLKKYGLLAGLGTVEGDHLRFSRSQVGLLDALLASQPEAKVDAVFARARDELRHFEGIQPSDPPSGFVGQLRGYQRDGLGWLYFLQKFGFGGCLADDMGLGKTVQVLALLESRREQRAGPSLVVVPRSLIFNWKQEATRFTPQLRVLDHTGLNRGQTAEHFAEYDLVLTTYGTLRRDALLFKDASFDYCILDESQAVKNASTESAKAVRLLRGNHRLALSGTPIENHLGELWSLFEFLNPGMLGSASVFRLVGAGARNPDEETRTLLARALRPFILRRTKAQVARDLPEKLEQTIYCELEPPQRKLYDELRNHYRQALLARIERDGMKKATIQILEALLRLRQAACHPGLIDKQRLADPSAKLDVLLPQLNDVLEEGHKVLLFSQFTSMLAIVRDRLDRQKIPYEYLDGRTRDRASRVERFQNDPTCKLFLISLKAGGLGLNLTAADYVFLLDPWWNPAVEAQAIDRAHRIGQTRAVFAYRLIARDTVEEKVLELQQTKRNLADAIINADNSLIRNLGREDLELLLS
jgi:superfamily II DNA or RNA helicase